MKRIVNVETGEVIERELNAEEIEQERIDALAFEAHQAEQEIKAQAKAKAEAKLAKLGLTTEDIRALGL